MDNTRFPAGSRVLRTGSARLAAALERLTASACRAMLIGVLLGTAAACSEASRPAVAQDDDARTQASATTYVFVCQDESEYVVRATADEAWVFRAPGALRLTASASPRGNLYSDGSFELLIEGEQAQMGTVGALTECRNDRRRAVWEKAKLDGADFRAVGNEPGWFLEIQAQSRIVFVGDYGATRSEFPLPEPVEDLDKPSATWDVGEFELEVIGRSCSDTMSGEQFESEVVIRWPDRTLRGCGRALH